MASEPIKHLALVVNADKAGAGQLARELAERCEQLGVSVRLTEEHPLPEDFLEGQDACCVFGGDGTLLSAVPQAVRYGVPVFGVNQGKLGFLATYSVEDIREQLENILLGQYRVVTRTVLRCITDDAQEAFALNDVVIKSTDNRKLIALEVRSNNELVTEYYSDGLIFATPTGSTAYNLSAGGPIVVPESEVITMTPICPHTLTNRSVVFPNDCRLRVHLVPSADVTPQVSLDGSEHFENHSAFPLFIFTAKTPLRLLQPDNHSHFSILRNKLGWGGS